MKLNHQDLAVSILRIALGINIFLHGIVRFGPNYSKFIAWITETFKDAPLPAWSVQAFAYSIPPLEAIIGLLLILGVFLMPTTIAGLALMIMLMAGSCLIQNWEIVGIQMIYILLYTVVLFFLNYNHYSFDVLVRKK
ncbi:DoxX family membrane protein [Bdellovibrio sp. KM01]|uniref:DoxX family membrane protein n=1 Tax=Bdellovibrio sp. KM01 TaxID=2748865 RepID=UPI0015E957BD|nr:DoxX family membrane protein [Bdellovibrio sp. KM01]QLY26523.1 DoxX family membrane protein [Bdellovibrio sp. KM01]